MTIPPNKTADAMTRSTPPWPRATLSLLTASLLIHCAGCRSATVIIPADREVKFLRAGQTFTATNDVWLVPPARMQEILDRLSTP